MLPKFINFTTPPHREQWMLFLGRAGMALGLLLWSSAVITVIAANWSHFSKVWRIAGVQVLIVALLGLSVYAGRHCATAWDKPYSPAALLLTGASVVVGALFALLGQTYQTGADPWQLFAVWAVVLLPWLWASRSLIIALLWIVLLNVSAVLWLEIRKPFERMWLEGESSSWALIVLNVLLVFLAERLHTYAADRYRILPRTALTLLVSAVMLEVVYWLFGDHSTAWLTLSLAGLFAAGLWYRYVHKLTTRDLYVGCLNYGFIFCLSIVALAHFNIYNGFNLLFFVFLHGAVAYFMLRDLMRRLHHVNPRGGTTDESEQAKPTGELQTDVKQPWFLRLFRSLIVLALGVMLSLYLGLTLWVRAPYFPVVLMALGFMAAVGLARWNTTVWKQDLAAVTLVSAMIFGVLSHITSDGEWLGVRFFIYALLGVGLYALSKSWPMRFFSSVWVIAHAFAWVLYSHEYGLYNLVEEGLSFSLALEVYAVFFIAIAFVLADLTHRSAQNYVLLSPAMWTSVIASFVAAMAVPPLWEFRDDGGLAFQWAFSSIVLWLLPSLCLYISLKRSQVKGLGALMAVVALGISTLLWSAFPALPLAFAWGALAYYWRNVALQVLVALVIVVLLGVLYYSLDLSLNQKALLLALTGLWLGLLALSLPTIRKAVSRLKPTAAQKELVAYRQPLLMLGLVLCLGLANYDVWSKERVLRDGQAVVLELAPVDPRSLMQGDYMVLRYRLNEQLASALRDPALWRERQQRSLWVWLAPDAQGLAWHVAAIQSAASDERVFWLTPSNQEASSTAGVSSWHPRSELNLSGLVKIRLRQGAHGWTPGTNAWFFAEGQAERYANAHYGEFVVNDGVALLRSMLDEEGQSMQ